jgi:spore coat polysaccharide biosynthesis protein SpsF (cytidylyltransferase family)
MNKQQTAVEWLIDRIEDVDLTEEMFEKIKQQAKELEKQQIIDAYEKGDKYKLEISGEQYYNETFNK